jgi:DNA modification methylase
MKNLDLFGNEIITDPILRDQFIEPPFSILDTKSGNWQKRKNLWKQLGIQSEIGRDAAVIHMTSSKEEYNDLIKGKGLQTNYTSIFDPALCEVLYKWFCQDGGKILDPFAGGSVRGIVANKLGYKYTGIDIRDEQVQSNVEQAINILDEDNQPAWLTGDSDKVLDTLTGEFDFVFSCPPYADLEVYSDLEGDISNMPYNEFLSAYESIIAKSCNLLKTDGLACFVVGEVRDKNGHYIGFVPDTIRAFEKCGMKFYNEAILLNAIASASLRANGNMKTQKLVKVHQNVLVFKKVVTPTKKQTPIVETVKDWKDVVYEESKEDEPQGFFAELEWAVAETKDDELKEELNDLPWEDTTGDVIGEVKSENKYPFEYVDLPDYCLLDIYSQQSEILDICKQLAKQYITFKYPGINITIVEPVYDEHETHIRLKYISCISEHKIKLSVRVQNIYESLVELYDM